jgi:SAM-dependent methyltransferase
MLMLGLLKRPVHRLGRWYIREMLRREDVRRQISRREEVTRTQGLNEQGVAFGFYLRQLYSSGARRVLDVGTGQSAWPRILTECGFHVTALDSMGAYWDGSEFLNSYYHVCRDDITRPRLQEQFDAILAVSVMSVIREHERALASMVRLLAPGGRIVLTCPYNESRFVDDAYQLPGSVYPRNMTYVCQVYSRAEIDRWCEQNALMVLHQEYFRVWAGELWGLGGRLRVGQAVARGEPCDFTGVVLGRRRELPAASASPE